MPDDLRKDAEVGYEERDIRAVPVVVTGFGVLAGTLLTVFAIWFVFAYLKRTHPNPEPRPDLAPEFSRMQQPILQSAPRQDLQSLRERDQRILNGYGWVDRRTGTVSIPVEKAIDKLLRQGMPPRGDTSDLKLYPPRAGSRQTGF